MDDSKPGIESTTRVEDSTPSNQTLCDWDPQEERRLLRRIDWRLIPVIILLFILNFLDRVNFAVARLQGLEEDLGLSDVEYQTGISILFAGYVSMQVPSNMILNKVSRPSWYIAGLVAIWGAITTATGGVQNASGAIALRFFLGVVEAGFTPGIVFYCSRWYKRNEIAFRVTIFTCGNLAAQAFGGLIGAGILSGMEGKGGLRSWRWLFIIEGAITVVLSSAALFLMPDYPRTTKWLSEREKHIAQTRLVLDVGLADEDDKGNAWHGLKLALLDPIVWILGLSYFLLVMGMTVGFSDNSIEECNKANLFQFSFFFPTIARSLGYGRIVTLLLTAPPWAFAVVVSVVVAWFADRFTARFIPIAGTVGTSFIGAVIAMNTSTIGPRYFSFFLMTSKCYPRSSYLLIMSSVC